MLRKILRAGSFAMAGHDTIIAVFDARASCS
jgi:hypothetical protein